MIGLKVSEIRDNGCSQATQSNQNADARHHKVLGGSEKKKKVSTTNINAKANIIQTLTKMVESRKGYKRLLGKDLRATKQQCFFRLCYLSRSGGEERTGTKGRTGFFQEDGELELPSNFWRKGQRKEAKTGTVPEEESPTSKKGGKVFEKIYRGGHRKK